MDLTPVAIVFIVFSFVAFVVKLGVDYSREKDRLSSQSEGTTLLVSELKELVQESVEEANRPLRERVNKLERQYRRLKAPDAAEHSDESARARSTPE